MDGETLAAAIRGAQGGDPAAYDLLLEQFGGRVYGFLYRSTGSRHESEDLLQEVFLRIVRMLPQYDHDGRFESWIFRIAANLIRDRIRRSKRSPKAVEAGFGQGEDEPGASEWVDDMPASSDEPESALVRSEDLASLNDAMSRLPDAEREVILLRHYSQMSFKQIAELMGTPLGTALARAHRGLGRLRTLMGEGGGTDEPQDAFGTAPIEC